jgi:hypothetical protein
VTVASLNPDLDSYIAHLPGVVAAVHREAEARAARVRAVAAGHSDSGAFLSSIKVEQGSTDTIIYSDDPNALSKNYGHQAANGRMVEGVHAFEAGL